jgi:aspartate-alanine antiporter
VGFESGPQFFSSLGKQSIKEIILAAVMAATGLATVVVMARLFGLDKGLAAGVAAGGLTQSAIIGTAGDAIGKLGLAAAETARLQGNVAIGYAVTYVFGSFGAIIVCVNILPKLMGRSIRDDAIAAETAMQAGVKVLGPDQEEAAPSLVGRIYQLTSDPQRTVADIENANPATTITIERVKRDGKFVEVSPTLVLRRGDCVLTVGRRDAVVASAPLLGKEVDAVDGMELTLNKREIVLTNKDFGGKTVDQIRQATAGGVRHGIFVVQLSRMGQVLPMKPDTVVQVGDLVSIFGAEQDVKRVASLVGDVIVPSAKTDFVYLGAGLVVGLLVGLLSVKIGAIPLTLGAGGGALLSGLQAVQTIKELGLTIFGVGVVVTLVPMILTMLFGRYVLRYENTAVFAGALSGSRSANPAFGEVLGKAENAIPTVPFAITYALANVFLTLLGPLIVALV